MWFRRKKPIHSAPVVRPAPPSIEVIAHKNATAQQTQAVKEANEHLQKIFDRDPFTVKLYVGLGGTDPKKTKGKK